jgi:hypothetical protein
MASVTFRILEGDDQGRVYSRLELPVFLGREDQNNLQLKDVFVSRYHAKLKDHSGRLILTDLGSISGTRVNGRHVQMRILQVGDIISVGRSALLLVDRQSEDAKIGFNESDPCRTAFLKGGGTIEDDSSGVDFVDPLPGSLDEPTALFPGGIPEGPSGADTSQKIQLTSLLSGLLDRVNQVTDHAVGDFDSENRRIVCLDQSLWKQLTSIQGALSDYICQIHTPE